MSENPGHDMPAEDVEVSDLLKKGLRASDESDACAGTVGDVAAGAIKLEYKDNLSEKEAHVLRRVLSTEGSVKKLKLFGIPLCLCQIALEGHDDGASSLEELELFAVEGEGKHFSVNLSGIFANLRVLNLSCNDIGDSFAKNIADFLKKNDTLRELGLWSNDIGDEGATALAEALKENGTLKKLALTQNNLTSQAILAFADALTVNSTLELVELFEVDIEEEDLAALFGNERYADSFKRIYILWMQEYLAELTRLLREDRHCSEVSIDVTDTVSEEHLREFFEAVAKNATVRTLHFHQGGCTFDALTDGLVSVLERSTTLTHVQNLMDVDRDETLVRILDALKENRSVTTFTMYAEQLTPAIATSLSQLLAANDVLNSVSVCEHFEISSDELGVVLEGLRKNYTLTKLMVAWDPDDSVEGVSEMAELLERNVRLLDRAVEFVRAGSAVVDDVEGADALKKVRSSAGLVDKLQKLTGKNKEAVLLDIEGALARLQS
ncbi:uncharacterized protein LOC144106192 [Amblyomma americanum]